MGRLGLALALSCLSAAYACTTIVVSGGATVDGVPMLAHTVDCWDCDNRVALVPSRDHEDNATHHVFGMGHQYPRITSDDRAWIYRPQPGVVRP
jgi:dipeptidase